MPPKFFQDGRETALHDHVMSLDQHELRGNPTAVLKAIDDYINTHTRMMIFQQPKVELTRSVLQKVNPKPKILVELGGYVGKSALAWGDMLQSFQSEPEQKSQVKVFSMELEDDFVKIIRDFVDLTGLEGCVEVVHGQSSDSLKSLKGPRGIDKIDVLFLDHWEQFYLSDLRLCEELGLLKVGSVVVADNTDMPGAPDYLKYMESGGENGWRYRCETMHAEGQGKGPSAVHFAFVEAAP